MLLRAFGSGSPRDNLPLRRPPMKRRVLLLCTGNSCRSQMAERIRRRLGAEGYEVYSAGTHPAEEVHPLAVEAMREIGIDISHQRPKHVNEFLDMRFHRVITVC